ncbi:ABC transporter ATP-binding protein [Pseudoalteromonas sp. MSK9-3]|uniref:ABC transporter ATP-binding protein n=1 Tax=Pseudoalteromonas sp. MSK9-3 TaxID=1897633 RepID=UPI000EBF5B90|nr:ABC transporter ATP-binding protein [Pseudoalteromonas sp. MSK9-3]RJE71251.1 ABC transporter ATP-binding protein [Pseudoalteromonas sp. MSK9-3]
MMDVVISMQAVNKVFETELLQTHALRNIQLIIREGEFVSISGPSGCGKSTLLSIMGLLESPSSGEYYINGTDVSKLTPDDAAEIRNKAIGFIFQSFNLANELSVLENVSLPLRYSSAKPDKASIKQRALACLEQVGLSHRAGHKPNQLSGGQQQRVAIARALIAEPAILLIDEPTGNLDSKSGDSVMRLIGELHRQGRTICMVTHDPKYADMAPKKIKLLDGEILGDISTVAAHATLET